MTSNERLDAFWAFVAERQRVFMRRAQALPQPWTDDPVLQQYRFTAPYRAMDRVSQYLIREVLQKGDQQPEEVVFRAMLFRIFNMPATWEALRAGLGEEPSLAHFNATRYGDVLSDAVRNGTKIWNNAYMMCGVPVFGKEIGKEKHRTYLALLEKMRHDLLPQRIVAAPTLRAAYSAIHSFPLMDDFVSMQMATDISYSKAVPWDDNDFVQPGPGAVRGLKKLQLPPTLTSIAQLADAQTDALPMDFVFLGGQPLSRMDVQNCLCEFDKWCRVAKPEWGKGIDKPNAKPKQNYRMDPRPMNALVLPPKWGVAHVRP